MPIGEAANSCPQTWIAEKTFTDFFSSFNKQIFSVLGGTTTSPNWLEEKVWGKGKGKRNMVAVYSMKWKTHSTHPTHEKKRKKVELTLCSVDRRWRWYVWKWHVFIYGWLIGERHCLVYFSLSLCVQSVIGWMEKIAQTDENDNQMNGLKMFAWNNVAILSSCRLTNIDMFDRVVWFKSREIIYRFRLYLLISCEEGITICSTIASVMCQ